MWYYLLVICVVTNCNYNRNMEGVRCEWEYNIFKLAIFISSPCTVHYNHTYQ
jgi:hypothetical protein